MARFQIPNSDRRVLRTCTELALAQNFCTLALSVNKVQFVFHTGLSATKEPNSKFGCQYMPNALKSSMQDFPNI